MTTQEHEQIGFYTVGEEIANAITHGIGVALSIIGLVLLVVFAAMAGDVWQIVGFSVYGVTLICAYVSSTLYHSVSCPTKKRMFRLWDHCSIYLLIAGTYTPFLIHSRAATWAWVVLGIVWGMAIFGIIFKTSGGMRFDKLSTLAYVLMGWLCVVAWNGITSTVPMGAIYLLIAGGLIYTVGVLFYIWDRLPYNHAIWHGFVLGGSVCHFLAMALFLTPITA